MAENLIQEYKDHGEKFPITLEFAYESDPDPEVSVERASADFLAALQGNYSHFAGKSVADDDELFILDLGFREAFINALYHGNYDAHNGNANYDVEEAKRKSKEDPEWKRKQVVVILRMDEQKFEVSIADEGKGIDRARVFDPAHPEHLRKPHGKGSVLDEHGYDKEVKTGEQGTTVILTKTFEQLN